MRASVGVRVTCMILNSTETRILRKAKLVGENYNSKADKRFRVKPVPADKVTHWGSTFLCGLEVNVATWRSDKVEIQRTPPYRI
jgi:hypothetical protein